MIKVLIGDIFKSECKTLVNTVNCVGVMGKGIAERFKDMYPQMYKEYVSFCKAGLVKPGKPYYYSDLFGNSIINFPTKDHWRSPSRLDYIKNGLDWFTKNYKELGIESIAFPPLGCGNGGLDWHDVGPLMYKHLQNLPINIEIYAPYGTSNSLLNTDFFEGDSKKKVNQKQSQLNMQNEWIIILEVIRILDSNPYSLYVGRTAFQKICYVMTELGLNTNFNFKEGQYGPYSHEVKNAITIFANNNLIIEERHGRMVRIKTSDIYKNYRIRFNNLINEYQMIIDKTVDLFSRIKDTQQAEVMITVLYTVKELNKKNTKVNEKQIYDYIIAWKKSWKNEDKSYEIASSIRNLIALDYIRAKYSSNLPYSEECV